MSPKRNAESSVPLPPAVVQGGSIDTLEGAAVRLKSTVIALRARLRRGRRVVGGQVVVDLGGGIRAFKFGRLWRVVFPCAERGSSFSGGDR